MVALTLCEAARSPFDIIRGACASVRLCALCTPRLGPERRAAAGATSWRDTTHDWEPDRWSSTIYIHLRHPLGPRNTQFSTSVFAIRRYLDLDLGPMSNIPTILLYTFITINYDSSMSYIIRYEAWKFQTSELNSLMSQRWGKQAI